MDTLFGEHDEHYLLCCDLRVRTNPHELADNESSAGYTYSVRERDQLAMVIARVHHSFLH